MRHAVLFNTGGRTQVLPVRFFTQGGRHTISTPCTHSRMYANSRTIRDYNTLGYKSIGVVITAESLEKLGLESSCRKSLKSSRHYVDILADTCIIEVY